MIGVKDNGHIVELGDFSHMLGSGDATSNGRRVILVTEGFSSNELTSTLGEGYHDGTSILGSSLHAGIDGVGTDNVDTWNGESLLLGMLEKINEGLTGHNTRLDGSRELGEGLITY